MIRHIARGGIALALAAMTGTPASAQLTRGPAGTLPVTDSRALDYRMEFSDAPLVVNAKTGYASHLPAGVKPLHYALTITPDPAQMRYEAVVRIDVETKERTDAITLNALDLTLMRATIDGRHAEILINRETQTATLQLLTSMRAGRHSVTIEYSGILDSNGSGFYVVDYDSAGMPKRALFTRFGASDARRVFPSWDEPGFATTFALDMIVRPQDGLALSNMPIAQRIELSDGRTRLRFATTPKMPASQFFMALGDFERLTQLAAGTEISVVTRRGAIPDAAFALKAGEDIATWYNDYFKAAYPLPKLDNIAVPATTPFLGATASWGAILYSEDAMLVDPRNPSNAGRSRVFGAVARDVARQWFGSMVTVGGWDDLWLNEGFVSWMRDKAMARFHPEWQPELDAVPARERAMALDGLLSTHPVIQPVSDPDALNETFDAITVAKGPAVIRMLETWVGADAWRDGVRKYLATYANASASSDDLWEAIESVAGKPVTDVAHQFTHQSGVPMIEVEDATCVDGKTMLALSQSEFTLDRPSGKAARWDVPVVAGVVGNAPVMLTVSEQKARAALDGCGPVVVNQGQTGYFRTHYAPALFRTVVDNFALLAPVDQLGILADAWALGLTGRQPATDALDLVAALPENAAPELWAFAARMLEDLASLAGYDTNRRAAIARFASLKLGPKLAALGWNAAPGESDAIADLRSTLLLTLGKLGDPLVATEARRRYSADQAVSMPAPLREAILGVVAANADRATWDYLRGRALAEKVPVMRSDYYRLVASTNSEPLAFDTLRLTLDEETPDADVVAILKTVAKRYPELAFEWAIAYRDIIEPKVPEREHARFFVDLVSRSSDGLMMPRVEKWVQLKLPVEQWRAAEPAIATLRYHAMVRSLRMPQIDGWFAAANARPQMLPRLATDPVQ